MATITLITGGQRSGKSSYAQKLAKEYSENPVFLATAKIWDDDFKNRIERHKSDRDHTWQTLEENKNISKFNLKNKTVVLDCITLWLTNFYVDNNYDITQTLSQAKSEWNNFIKQDFKLIVVSNELGMGIHSNNEIGRKFADLQGWMNQYIASMADNVYFMVAGIPLKIK